MDQGAAQPRKKTAKTASTKQPKYSPKRLAALIREGEDNVEHRRYAVAFVIEQLIRSGRDDNYIVNIFHKLSNRIGDYYRDTGNGTRSARHDVKEIRAIVEAATGDPAKDSDSDKLLEDRVALQLSTIHADNLRYVEKWGQWLHWDSVRWVTEEILPTFDRARPLCREAGDARARTIAAVAKITSSDERQRASVEQWNVNKWLAGTPQGTLDLKTGKLIPVRSSDYITKLLGIAPGGKCPLWHEFLKCVTADDSDLQRYLQRVSGYCLTGDTSEEALFFLHGVGQNGKGTFTETMAGILGDYHQAAAMETFTVTYGSQHTTDLAMLYGARVVTADETEEGKQWAEAKIKKLTGGGKITARFMRANNFQYVPEFKLMISGNHKPAIRSVDKAIRRRMNLVPFTVTISEEKRDNQLKAKLKAEWPGILEWMLEGCLDWQRNGLKPPERVIEATGRYLEEQDLLQRFLTDGCKLGKNESDTPSHIFRGWVDYCERARENPGTQQRFLDRLVDRGFPRDRDRRGDRVYLGLRCTWENQKDQIEELRRKGLSGEWGGGLGPTPLQRAQAEISVKRNAGTIALCAHCSKGHEIAPVMIVGCGDLFPEMPLHPDCALSYFVQLIFRTQAA